MPDDGMAVSKHIAEQGTNELQSTKIHSETVTSSYPSFSPNLISTNVNFVHLPCN